MGTVVGPDVVTRGLVLALDAGTDRSYPGTGTVWTDVSGKGNNATSQASASTTAGIFNSEGYFNLTEAADVFFLIPGLNDFFFGTTLGIEFWIKNTGGDYRAVIQNSDSSSASSDTIDIRFGRESYTGGDNDGTYCQFSIKCGGSQKTQSFPLNLNVWTHVHCSYSGTAIRIYLNGSLFKNVTENNVDIDTVANDMKLFRHYNTGEDLVNPFASIKLYKTILSTAEVVRNYNQTKNKFI